MVGNIVITIPGAIFSIDSVTGVFMLYSVTLEPCDKREMVLTSFIPRTRSCKTEYNNKAKRMMNNMPTLEALIALITRYNELFDEAVEHDLSDAEDVFGNDPEYRQGRHGVYGIVYEDDLIYVGKSNDVKRRIVNNLLGTGSHILKKQLIETDEYNRVMRNGHFKYIFVDSKIDAMLMEAFFIKKHEDEIEFNDEIENHPLYLS